MLDIGAAGSVTDERFANVIDVNLTGALRVTRAAQHLLGHRNPATTSDHYILAGNIEAARTHQAVLASLRARTNPRKRRP